VARILVVDDEMFFRHLLCKILNNHGYETVSAESGEQALEILRAEAFDLMISDISMSPIDGMELLSCVRESFEKMSIIMLTANDSVPMTVKSMKVGAFDYLTKPVKVDALIQVVRNALEYNAAQSGYINIQEQLKHRSHMEIITGLVTESSDMLSVSRCIERLSPTDATVLIYGEEGSGKALVARSIYRYSQRKKRPLTTVSSLDLIRLEKETVPFEITHDGTLFLDGIHIMPPVYQAQLMDFFRGNTVPTGEGAGHMRKKIRIIASSGENLEHLIEQGRLREDIYRYLTEGVVVELPPLRRRPRDILPLVLQTLRRKLGPEVRVPMLDYKTQWVLEHYTWPGNVRELEEAVLHAAAAMRNNVITVKDLPAPIVAAVGEDNIPTGDAGCCEQFIGKSAKDLLRHKQTELLERVSDIRKDMDHHE